MRSVAAAVPRADSSFSNKTMDMDTVEQAQRIMTWQSCLCKGNCLQNSGKTKRNNQKFFRRFSKSCEKQLLASSCPSVRPHDTTLLPLVLYMNIYVHFLSYLAQLFLELEMLQAKFVEKIKTHIFCSIIFTENLAFYEIMWKNMIEPGRPQMTIWRIRFTCWINKATDTHSECVILIAFPW